jgi:hypothetical protein
MQTILRNYSTSASIDFDLYSTDGSSILTSASFTSGCCVISSNGISALSVNLPSVTQNGFTINFTSGELTTKKIHVKLVDTNVTKGWLDTSWNIETYNCSAAEHGNIASGLLDNSVDGIPLRDLFIEMISQVTGDFLRSGDAFEYFRRDRTTQSHVLSASYGARTRV